MNNISVAFDVDGTLIHQVGSLLDTSKYDMVQLFKLLEAIGCKMHIWSGGGVEYAERWRDKLGLDAKVVRKGSFKPDIAVDDQQVTLGTVNLCLTDEVWVQQENTGLFVYDGE